MTSYTWTYGEIGSGTRFEITYDSGEKSFTVKALEGTVDIKALWFSDGDKTSDGYTLNKSLNNLNMNGTNTVWAVDFH